MDETLYVQFEPGPGSQRVMTPKTVVIPVVDAAPEVGAVASADADKWFENPAIDNLTHVRTGTPGTPGTSVAMMRDDRYLFVAFHCAEPRMADVQRLVPTGAKGGLLEIENGMSRSITHDDSVGVYIDGRHERASYHVLTVNVNGARKELLQTTSTDWLAVPPTGWKEMDDLKWESDVFEGEDFWRAAFRIDMKSIEIDPESQPTVGINLVRCRHVDYWVQYSWCDIVHTNMVHALTLGEGYLGDRGVIVRKIDWGDLGYGANELSLTVDSTGLARQLELKVHLDDREGGHCVDTESDAQTITSSGVLKAPFTMVHNLPACYVTAEVVDSNTGESLYRSRFPIRDHGDIRFGHRSPTGAVDDPSPDDPDFRRKKIAYILSKLPRFCRRNTTEGAPSDFTLAAKDGSVEFNLMEAGALKKIADWICTLFDSDDDRLVAAAIFTNDDWVTTHAHLRVRMQFHLTPLSTLRLGSGHCYARAQVGAGLCCELPDPLSGKNYEAWPTLVLGHVITSIKRGDDYVFIDPSFGHFFYNEDNTTLATSRELAKDHSLVERAVIGDKRWLNYRRRDAHVRLEMGTIVWPTGAPPR